MSTTRAAAAGAARTSESKPAITSLESTTRRSRYRKRRVAPATAVNTLGQDEPAGAPGFPPGRAVGAGACPRPGHLGPVRPADAERDLRQRERRCGRRNGTDRDLDPGRLHARPGATAGDGPRPVDRRPRVGGGARRRGVDRRGRPRRRRSGALRGGRAAPGLRAGDARSRVEARAARSPDLRRPGFRPRRRPRRLRPSALPRPRARPFVPGRRARLQAVARRPGDAGDLPLARLRHAADPDRGGRRADDMGSARARAVAERPDAAGAPDRAEGPVRPPRPPPACRKAARPRRRPGHRLADRARASGDACPSPGAEVDRDESSRPLPDDGSGGAADRVLRVVAAVSAPGLLLAGDRTRRLRDRDDEPGGEPPGRRATAPLRLRRARGKRIWEWREWPPEPGFARREATDGDLAALQRPWPAPETLGWDARSRGGGSWGNRFPHV